VGVHKVGSVLKLNLSISVCSEGRCYANENENSKTRHVSVDMPIPVTLKLLSFYHVLFDITSIL
jgi:hypothetical protein